MGNQANELTISLWVPICPGDCNGISTCVVDLKRWGCLVMATERALGVLLCLWRLMEVGEGTW